MFSKSRLYWAVLTEFKVGLFMLFSTIMGGGALIQMGKNLPYADAMLAAFFACFFEIIIDPPFPWYIDIFLFIAPFVGIYVLADSIATLATILFGKRQKLQKWWEIMASTYQDHVVVCGIGKVGYRVVNELRKSGVLVVGIEENLDNPFVQELLDENIPIIQGNGRLRSVLDRAGIRKARAILCVTNDDLTNLDCAFTAREVHEDIRAVIRVFDDTIAKKMSTQFDLPAISTSHAAAPAFVAEALQLDLPQTQFSVYGHPAQIHAIQITQDLAGKTIATAEDERHIKVLGYKDKGGREIFPGSTQTLEAGGQVIAVSMEREY